MSFISRKLNKSRRFSLQKNEMPISSAWISVAYGNGRFVAISEDRKITYSDDGINWIFLENLSFQVYSITYGNGKFVIAGNGTYVSLDGINWTHYSSSFVWTKVKYLNNVFILLGENTTTGVGTAGISTDGITWTYNSLNNPLADFWTDVAYGSGKFVAISGEAFSRSSYSVDGITWVSNSNYQNLMLQSGASINYVVNRFVMTLRDGGVYFSSDGINFTISSGVSIGRCYGVTYGGGKLVAVSYEDGHIRYSDTGTTWISIGIPIETRYYSIIYGDNKFVAVGVGRYSAYSSDAINWNSSILKSTKGFTAIAYGADKFVAVGFNGISAYSNNGKDWNISDSTILSDLYKVAYGNGKFIAIGSKGVCRSDDGINWITTNTSYKPTTVLVYGDGKFVADTAYSIDDGITWTNINSLPSTPTSMTYGDGKFVAIYRISNTTAYSSDGINWNNGGLLPSIQNWRSVAYGNGRFVAVGEGDKTAYSKDGINWIQSNLQEFYFINTIAYGNGIFVAIEAGNIATGFYGYNGINWIDFPAGFETLSVSIAYGNSKFVYVNRIGTGLDTASKIPPSAYLLSV